MKEILGSTVWGTNGLVAGT